MKRLLCIWSVASKLDYYDKRYSTFIRKWYWIQITRKTARWTCDENIIQPDQILWQLTAHARIPFDLQYISRKMHTVFALLCFVVVIHWLIFPYPSGLLHWHCGNLTIVPVPAKQPWWIWINTSCESIMNDCITTTKQSTTKPCAYFLGYTVDDDGRREADYTDPTLRPTNHMAFWNFCLKSQYNVIHGLLFIKMTPSYGYRAPHEKPKTVWRPPNVYNGNPYTDNTAS